MQMSSEEIQRPGCFLPVAITGEIHKGMPGVGICIELVRLVIPLEFSVERLHIFEGRVGIFCTKVEYQ